MKVSEDGVAYEPVALALGGSKIVVAWQQHESASTSGVRMRMIDRVTLEPLPGNEIVVASSSLKSASNIRLAASPDGFGLTHQWKDYTFGDITSQAHFFDSDGQTQGWYIDATSGGGTYPSLAYDGTYWGFFYLEGGHLWLRALAGQGSFAWSQLLVNANSSGGGGGFNPTTGHFVAAYLEATGLGEIATVEAGPNGAVIHSGTHVSLGGGAPKSPELAWSGDGFGVVWDDSRSGIRQIYFRALDSSGEPTGEEIPVGGNGTSPRIATNGTVFAIVWRDAQTSELHFKAIDHAGQPVGDEIVVATGLAAHLVGPNVTWDGERFVVVWFANEQGFGTEKIYAAAVCP